MNDDKEDRWIDENKQVRPRRTAGHGLYTGLRFTVKSQIIPPYVKVKSGIVVSVHCRLYFDFNSRSFLMSRDRLH